jgi:RNA polymerase sigma-70 factor (ECF subfamily)
MGGRDTAQEPDAELVARARQGDTSALADLYAAHVRGVTTAVRHNMGDADMIADVVQEAFARAFEQLHKLREPARFRPWVLAIARHAAVDHARDRARVTLPGDAGRLDDVVDQRDTAEQLSEFSDLFARCTARLSARDVRTLGLIALLDCSPADVARALGISPGTAKVVVHRARRRFGDALALSAQPADT